MWFFFLLQFVPAATLINLDCHASLAMTQRIVALFDDCCRSLSMTQPMGLLGLLQKNTAEAVFFLILPLGGVRSKTGREGYSIVSILCLIHIKTLFMSRLTSISAMRRT